MASKDSAPLMGEAIGLMPFLHFGGGATALQREMLEAYEQLNRAWLDRVQSEVALWSDLATKLAAVGSFPEALEAYVNCLSKRMQMTAEDGQRLFNGYQK